MRRPVSLFDSTVGKKIAMAVSGVILVGFLIVHMLGNLKVYQGAEAFNHYAEGLRTIGAPFFARGQLLWVARAVLLAAVGIHILAAVQLTLHSRAARTVSYTKYDSLAFSYASRTMVWGGVVIVLFVIYHLLDFTLGTVHPSFVPGDAYHNFVTGFQRTPVAVAYIVAMIPLGLHLYHGIWSGFQTLGANNPKYNKYRRPLSLALTLAVILGNISFPVAVMTGLVK